MSTGGPFVRPVPCPGCGAWLSGNAFIYCASCMAKPDMQQLAMYHMKRLAKAPAPEVTDA